MPLRTISHPPSAERAPSPPPPFVALDFEIAYYGRAGAYALALVKAGVIVQRACTHEILQCQPSRREPSLATGSSSDNITGPGSSAKASGARDACGGTDVVLEGVAEAVPAAQHPVGGGLHGG